ncbi:NAD(P)H-dependent oxidoreductase [Marispirochaeta sp.]|jgi:NAD(P)H dehydrogenase (quinone)|uniref:NAD(P)H-dependent oxidoreductase n=1 Tax=Marispirochaeta sp. TaxID=2038653 RepID=UPI0029C71298|nr:NAD(P)H-dependent oxidoreductase [Marispirochaeta sp.]
MNKAVLIILGHPDSSSFCGAAAEALREAAEGAGAGAEILNLYAEGFDPVLTSEEAARRFSFDTAVQKHQQLIQNAELVAWVHPDWWGAPPGIVKGWLDRVLQPGFAFSFEEDFSGRIRRMPLLKGKKAITVISSDADATEPVPAADMWQKRVFHYCGFGPAEVLVLPETRSTDYSKRTEFLAACAETLTRLLDTGNDTDGAAS